MRFTGIVAVTCFFVLLAASPTFGQLRIVTYNTLDNPRNATDDANARTVFAAIAGLSVNGIAKRPDVIALQEQTSTTASRLASQLNLEFGVNSYTALNRDSGTDQLAFVYDSASLDLLDSVLVPMPVRPAHRVKFRPVGYTAADSEFYVYSFHLKAGNQQSDQTTRAAQTSVLRTNADGLGQNANIIYAGDYNIKQSGDTAYQNLLAAGDGKAVDPIATPNWTSLFNIDTHTQSTRTSDIGDGGSSGGMDDRFDQMLTTNDLMDGDGLSYIGPTAPGTGSFHSYQAFGNDGTSYNQTINNTMSGRSQPASVLNALYYFSDHLPVVADIQLPAKMDVVAGPAPARIITGTAATVTVQVENTANVIAAAGADALDYTAQPFGDVTGTAQAGAAAALAGANDHDFGLDTSAPGPHGGQVAVSSTNEGLNQALMTETFIYTVLDHGNGSFAATADQDTLTIDFGQQVIGSGVVQQAFDLFNLEAAPSFTAELDVTAPAGASGDTGVLAVTGAAGVLAAGNKSGLQASLDTAAAGNFQATWEIAVADHDVLGGGGETLEVTLQGVVVILGDYNASGAHDPDDIDRMFAATGTSVPPTDAHFDLIADQTVTQADVDELVLNVMNKRYGDSELDQDVDITDFNTQATNFDPGGSNGAVNTWARGNFDGDDDIDISDFNTMASNFAPGGYDDTAAVVDQASAGTVDLVIDVTTGEIALAGNAAAISGLQVFSAGDGLLASDFSAEVLQFVIATSTSTYAEGAFVDMPLDGLVTLGMLYNVTADVRDLSFEYTAIGQPTFTGNVIYVPEPASLALLIMGAALSGRRRRAG